MAPNTAEESTVKEDSEWDFEQIIEDPNEAKATPPMVLVWRNIIFLTVIHIFAVIGFYQVFTTAKILTLSWACFLISSSAFSVAAGCHRLWSHRSYKAKPILKLILMIFNCIAFQNDIIEWCKDHRVHHKYSETNADPHNAKRGFFFAHIGWLMCRKHPDVIEKGKNIDISDLLADPILTFQKRYFLWLGLTFSLLIPALVPVYFWGEDLFTSFCVSVALRFCVTTNIAWLVNSAAHLWGSTPYDKSINPSDNIFVSFVAAGEGWHNYHHTFPMDYKTAELPYFLNYTTAVINVAAKLGLAYDLKSVPKHVIEKRKQRTGEWKEKHN